MQLRWTIFGKTVAGHKLEIETNLKKKTEDKT